MPLTLVNQTRFPAELVRSQTIYRDLLLATIVVKISLEVDAQGWARPLPEAEQLGIYEADTESPLGLLESDLSPIKRGCDLAVYGNAISPGGAPVTELDTGLRIEGGGGGGGPGGAGFERRVRVVGDRAWLPTGAGVRMSNPQPFTELPMTWDRAYGGTAVQVKARDKTLASPYHDNPDGRGHVVLAELAPGVLLPNLEELDQPIRDWPDQVMPASFLPIPRRSALRGPRGIDVDVAGQTIAYTPEAFCFAHPRMWLPEFPHGQRAVLWGFRSDGPWRLTLPRVDLQATIALGESAFTLRLVPDTLMFVPAYGRLVVLARRAFIYQFKPERIRTLTLAVAGGPVQDAGELTSIAAQRQAAGSDGAILELLPVETDPAKMPVPFEMLQRSDPMRVLLEPLPLCPSP